ncbi:MAG: hypothetical protein ABI587_17870 [Gemmatimonadales bacterium]
MLHRRMGSEQLLMLAVIVLMGCAPDESTAPAPEMPPAPTPARTGYLVTATPIDLGTLGGPFQHSVATGLNDLGQVVGWSETGVGVDHAFLWQQGSGMIDLGTPNGQPSYATAINPSGLVAGYTRDASGREAPWVWAGGVFTLLPLPGGATGRAMAIEPGGTLAGCMLTGAPDPEILRWVPKANQVYTRVSLGVLPGQTGHPACATGIDQFNRVTAVQDAGWLRKGSSWKQMNFGPSILAGIDPSGSGRMTGGGYFNGQPFHTTSLYFPTANVGAWIDFVPVICTNLPLHNEVGWAVNFLGWVVGWGTNCDLPIGTVGSYAYVWAPEGESQLLPPISGNVLDGARALAVNMQNQAAGESAAFPGKFHATLWNQIAPDVSVLQLPVCSPRPCVIPPKVTYIPKKFINDGILTRPGFDATLLDPNFITLGDGLGHATPVARTASGALMASLTDVDGDGILDIKVSFSKAQLIADGVLTPTTRNFEISAIEPTGLPWKGHYPIWVQ